MENQRSFIFFFLLFSFTITSSAGHAIQELHKQPYKAVKLFVFGDSYADTGNRNKADSSSWMEPYGITFPGKPAGRFSDGRVLTDYVASFLGVKSPPPYKLRKYATKSQLGYGMNFAYGGSGVFNTIYHVPNISTQINFFQKLLEEILYTKSDLNSSIALVSLAGNDYTTFLAQNGGKTEGFEEFTRSMINQLIKNLQQISDLGLRRIMVTAIEPLGCLPTSAALSSYKSCNKTSNASAKFHNKLLRKSVHKLNQKSRGFEFGILDLYRAFMSAIKRSRRSGILKPCCVGVTNEYSCGSVDENGEKKYLVCSNPKLSIFWDEVHPSQNGWHSIYLSLRSELRRLRL
ncbi:GDSL esterase/lipase At5g03610-like isoform X1 [Tripterygium wilfordii]|uniref:GDSL esterase/lipase At5g03610-like isoform X1 n=1 Tax=Tripterygium wilfordii TaxID=458696 RepID=UPI0018F81247|nr:GDSL esterase/lipase At5g03610-like isoform X1 [Tripterygium wilfordii]